MRILFIEDDPAFGTLIAEALKNACYAVDWSRRGDDGLFLARTNEYDLILTDCLLPGMNGFDIIKALKNENYQTPIIMLTIQGEQQVKLDAFTAGAVDFLSKPFLLEELLARIQCRVLSPALTGRPVFCFDGLVVDTDAKTVTRHDKEIYLTNKEYSLLEFFLNHQKKIVSRSFIMEHVWDAKADPFSNTVETHVMRLRKKLSRGRRRSDLIQTLPNRGYRFRTEVKPQTAI
jgi:DNA-binding response OmpR family regulator